MTENISELEKKIKKLFIKLHLEVLGKGPEEVWVKTNRNVVTFYCGGILTPMEEFLLKYPGGEKDVSHLRQKLFNYIKSHVIIELESFCGVEVLGISAEINTKVKCFYGSILIKSNFDEKIKGPKIH